MDEIQKIYAGLADHWLRPIFAVALGSGAKRGELLALRWSDIADSEIRIERSLEQTKDGIRFKPPKSRHGQAIHPVAGVGYVRD
jgi:integrase